MTMIKQRLRDESGMSAVEMMLVLSLGLIVMFAVLTTLDGFSSNTSRQSRVADANNQVRNIMDRVVADLRQAATVEVAAPNDLVYTLSDTTTELDPTTGDEVERAVVRRERICLDDARKLWRTSLRYAPPPASVPGHATALAAAGTCPTPAIDAAPVTNLRSRNSVSNPIFRYDSATPAGVRTIGMTFALDAGNAHHNDTSTLRASAFRRAEGEAAAAVTDDDIATQCDSSGPLLTLSSSVGTASVTYATLGGTSLGTATSGSSLRLPATTTTVVATVTTSSGAVTQILKKLAC